MITRLEVNRYRCFEQLGIDVGDFQVIVGANGAGKTTLVDIPILLGELLMADNLASVFLMRHSEKPARASNLRELIFSGRGDDFSLAIEAKLPESEQKALLDTLLARAKSEPEANLLPDMPDTRECWPTHIRYELRLVVIDDRHLAVMNEYLFFFPEAFGPDRASGGLAGDSAIVHAGWHFILRREFGGPAVFSSAVGPCAHTTLNIADNLLALSAVKNQPDVYPAANWLYQRLTEQAVFLDPK